MSDFGDEFEARARREASGLLAKGHPDIRIEQYPALHDLVTLAFMKGYRDGTKETTDEFRAITDEPEAQAS